MKTPIKTPIISLIVLLFLAAPVLAIEDFAALGEARLAAFRCSPLQTTVTVQNTGTEQSTYDIFAEGPARDWVIFVPEFFTLAPGQSQAVTEFISIPCDAPDRDSFIDVVIQTDTIEKILAHDLSIRTPQNVQLIPQVFEQEILPCGDASFSVLLHNPASFAETYTLSIDEMVADTILSDDKLTIEPGENHTILVRVQPKDCTLAGEFAPVLVVRTEKTRLAAELDLFLRINKTDIVEIAKGVTSIRTTHAPQQAEFTIENLGDRKTGYTLTLDGPDWITVQPDQLAIDRNKKETLKLVMTPAETVPAGKYALKITATVDATGTEYAKTLTIHLKRDTILDKLFDEYLPFTIGGIVVLVVLALLVVAGIKKYHSPEAKQKREERRKEREALRQQKLKEREERKKQREEERRKRDEERQKAEKERQREEERKQKELERERERARKEAERELKAQYKLIAKDEIVAGRRLPGKSGLKTLLIILVLAMIFLVITNAGLILRNLGSVVLGLVLLVGIIVIKRMEQRRKTSRAWKLVLANEEQTLKTAWRAGLKAITFTLTSPAEKLRVLAKRLRPKDAPENAYQAFSVEANVDHDILSEATYAFKVRRSWLVRNAISPSDVKLMQQKAGRWQGIGTQVTSTDATYVHYAAEADCFGTFAIVGKRRSKEQKAPLWGYIGLGVLVAVALALTYVLSTPDDVAQIRGIPAQTWTQDTQHTLDLKPFFKDPDNDLLTFSSTRAAHVAVDIIDGIAVLTPEAGWYGQDAVVFVADDGKGGVVKSNVVRLVVRKALIPAAVKSAAPYALIGVIILAVILAIALFRKRVKKFLEE